MDDKAQSSSSISATSSQIQSTQRYSDLLVDPSVYAYCEDVSKYEKLSKIGQGIYSKRLLFIFIFVEYS